MQDLFDLLKAHADSETAVGMAAYQRNQFSFLGIGYVESADGFFGS